MPRKKRERPAKTARSPGKVFRQWLASPERKEAFGAAVAGTANDIAFGP